MSVVRGKPHATFEAAGAGNETMAAGLRATAKAVEQPPEPNVGAPVLDPTDSYVYAALIGTEPLTPLTKALDEWAILQGHANYRISMPFRIKFGDESSTERHPFRSRKSPRSPAHHRESQARGRMFHTLRMKSFINRPSRAKSRTKRPSYFFAYAPLRESDRRRRRRRP